MIKFLKSLITPKLRFYAEFFAVSILAIGSFAIGVTAIMAINGGF